MRTKQIPKAGARTCCNTPIGNPHAATCRHAYRELCERWEKIKADFVSAVHFEMMRDHAMRRRYAYVKPSGPGVWGELAEGTDASDPADGFELITAEPIPSGDKATIASWLERFAGKLPVFPQQVQS